MYPVAERAGHCEKQWAGRSQERSGRAWCSPLTVCRRAAMDVKSVEWALGRELTEAERERRP